MRQNDLNNDQTLRMYSIIRGDLDMTPGKSAAQAGHTFKLLTKNILEDDPQTAERYFSDGGIGTNICLSSKNLESLLYAHEQCERNGIPSVLITDSGHIMLPHFDGSPIITALGIGPARRCDVDQINKRFKLYK